MACLVGSVIQDSSMTVGGHNNNWTSGGDEAAPTTCQSACVIAGGSPAPHCGTPRITRRDSRERPANESSRCSSGGGAPALQAGGCGFDSRHRGGSYFKNNRAPAEIEVSTCRLSSCRFDHRRVPAFCSSLGSGVSPRADSMRPRRSLSLRPAGFLSLSHSAARWTLLFPRPAGSLSILSSFSSEHAAG